MQAILSFDVYERYLLKKNQNSQHILNHVAGMMHRYWDNLFHPQTNSRESLFNRNSIIEAMDISEDI